MCSWELQWTKEQTSGLRLIISAFVKFIINFILASKVYQPLVHTGKRAIGINSKFNSFSRLQEPIDDFSQDIAPVKVHKILLGYCWIDFSNIMVFYDQVLFIWEVKRSSFRSKMTILAAISSSIRFIFSSVISSETITCINGLFR